MKEKMNNKIKLKWKNIILILIFLILFITLNISIYNIIKWKLDSKKTNEEKKILMDTLVEETMLSSELRDKLKCDGYVTIKKRLSKYEFKPYIKCDGYETIK